jgi:hypothetical protein
MTTPQTHASGAARRRRIICALGVVCALGLGGDAMAEPTPDERAQELARKCESLRERARYQQAVTACERSLALGPSLRAELNLALSFEGLGEQARGAARLRHQVRAHARYRRAILMARAAGKTQAEKLARNRAENLARWLVEVMVVIDGPAANAPSVEVQIEIDGEPGPAPGDPVWLAPGARDVRVTADGYAPFSERVALVRGEFKEIRATLTPLERPSVASGAESDGAAPDQPAATAAPNTATSAETPDARAAGTGAVTPAAVADRGAAGSGGGTALRVSGLVVGGLGVATVGAGLGFGALATRDWNDAVDQGLCSEATLICTAEGQALAERSRGRARIANIAIGAGAAAIALGITLYVLAPERKRDKRSAHIAPVLDPRGAGVAVFGRF